MTGRLTRRDALAGIGGVLGASAFGPIRARAQTPSVSVATRNCYLGANLFRLLAAATVTDTSLPEAVGNLVTAVDRSYVERRLGAVADELARTTPDLVGVQEAPLIRTGAPTDGTTPTATDVRYDFRETLRSALSARDLPYRVVAATETTDIQLPATVDGERLGVRLTDRDLILAHESATAGDPVTGTFDASFSLTRNDRTVTINRGYGVVDATVGGTRLTFCNTHLESVSAETRGKQATELRGLLDGREDPVVLVGDLNSGPGASTAVYDDFTGPYRDAASDAGNTCCHAADLRNAKPTLDSRIDHVLVRGDLRATDVTRLGADPADRIAVESGDDVDRLWPSDHAGVVATLAPEVATPTSTATPTRTATATRTATPTVTATDADPTRTVGSAPGYGSGAAVSALAVAALAAFRRARDD
ncbi:MAG: endonuclease/exonuclease/phosphatase family protein [Haloplanus sp.]